MKELDLFSGLNDGIEKQTMSSREIAELAGKRHSDVLEAVRNMEPAWVKITGRNFPLSTYKDSTGRRLPFYDLSKTECLYIATKFNDEARAKLIIRWEELERSQAKINLPKTYSEALRELADAAEKVEKLELQAKEDAPKVLFSDAVATSRSSCLIGELAKLVRQNGVDIGQNRLFQWMRDNGYLCSFGERRNQPTQKAMDLELFEVKKVTVEKPSGEMLITTTTKVTGKGQIYFINKLLKNGIEDLSPDRSLKPRRL